MMRSSLIAKFFILSLALLGIAVFLLLRNKNPAAP